ncbi:beta-1,4-galactosyltransferase 4-like isoform X1 [Biomphalaria glabrata]|uniref:Beta-1,4-galactosyltransferase n=1 Tax=Biomphalaria glabrata TaxID=6526 RepID=A0A9W2YX50_BIOGL|nr:beta-1,4-galactosyltransferase 4-like isoform X1 [Biomphalaria glabrata]XP_013075531.2 beta-1,4-galactosyltransferase 4-like isoform X1 [Biomphalaria glabrata]XP_055867314.1 beta-1,4-galactosyltransferase 4-like isoform X1 [Biomphalaria glabrata]XP_055867315.1 beta-1,4-galactosyltransferase 4-like isoform X1 [Biomphalaria glabrata]
MTLPCRGRLRWMFGVVCCVAILFVMGLAVWINQHMPVKRHGGIIFEIDEYSLEEKGKKVNISDTKVMTSERRHSQETTLGNTYAITLKASEKLNNLNSSSLNLREATHDKNGTLKFCSLSPTDLVGNLACKCNETTPEEILRDNAGLIKEGRVQPLDCIAMEKVAIVIPYRDRYKHLHQLLSMLIPILSRQKVDATIFVVEQVGPVLFNRGALHNVGFLEAEKLGKFDCYIFHDVDLVPLNDQQVYSCGDNPIHFSVAIKYGLSQHFRIMYKANFGGVVGLTRDQYLALNGNSNLYFGWGGEDDDLAARLNFHNMTKLRRSLSITRYAMLGHQRQNIVNGNPARNNILKTAKQRMKIDGLNTIEYVLHNLNIHPLYVWFNVTLLMKEMFQSAPDFLQNEIAMMTQLEEKKARALLIKSPSRQIH